MQQYRSTTSLSLIGPAAASLLAGSVGGAIGVGVAYPLDTLKTKSQVLGQQRQEQNKQKRQSQIQGQNGTVTLAPPGSVHSHSGDSFPIESPEDDLVSLVKLILEMEGIAGFFGGVKAMMIGQALIKSVAFSANNIALGVLNDVGGATAAAGVGGGDDAVSSSFVTLVLAASFSGFVTSFLVAPVGKSD